LDVEAVELGGSGSQGEQIVGLAVGELDEANPMTGDLGEEDGAAGLRQDFREGFLGKALPDLPRDRRPDALSGVGVEKDLRCQDAQAEGV
jgi:hypothetical protein